MEHETVRFAGLQEPTSLFRGQPSLELDAAWDDVTLRGNFKKNAFSAILAETYAPLTDFQPVPHIPASANDVRQAGITLDIKSMVRIPEESGSGLYADFEWKHQLHCLVREHTV